jgi:hypothetical protein
MSIPEGTNFNPDQARLQAQLGAPMPATDQKQVQNATSKPTQLPPEATSTPATDKAQGKTPKAKIKDNASKSVKNTSLRAALRALEGNEPASQEDSGESSGGSTGGEKKSPASSANTLVSELNAGQPGSTNKVEKVAGVDQTPKMAAVLLELQALFNEKGMPE